MDENTNITLKEHEIRTSEWEFSELSDRLYTWFDRFNQRFFENRLKIPVLSFERTRVQNLGHFVLNRNSLGLKWNINVNSRYTDLPFIDVLAILLHELVHLWIQEFGRKKEKGSQNNYHIKEFRIKAGEIGIPSDKYGRGLGYQNPFLSLLKKHEVSLESKVFSELEPDFRPEKGRSKLKKWSCGCTNVRVAIKDFRAKCLKCGNEFCLGQ